MNAPVLQKKTVPLIVLNLIRYRQKVDISDTDKITLQEFVVEGNDHWEDEILVYCDVWNKVRNIS